MQILDSTITVKVAEDESGNPVFAETHPISKIGNMLLEEDLKIMLPENEIPGSFKKDEVIPAGTTLTEILKRMLQKLIPPLYTQPSISLTGTNSGSYEVGSLVAASITSKFTKNDAGEIISHKIFKSIAEVDSVVSPNAIYNEELTVIDGVIAFTSKCSYGAGDVKLDNYGNPYPDTSIKAGVKSSGSISYNGVRHAFSICNNDNITPSNSDVVRTNGGFNKPVHSGGTFTFSLVKGNTNIFIMYPANLPAISMASDSTGKDITSDLTLIGSTVNIEGANKYTGIAYKIYLYHIREMLATDSPITITL